MHPINQQNMTRTHACTNMQTERQSYACGANQKAGNIILEFLEGPELAVHWMWLGHNSESQTWCRLLKGPTPSIILISSAAGRLSFGFENSLFLPFCWLSRMQQTFFLRGVVVRRTRFCMAASIETKEAEDLASAQKIFGPIFLSMGGFHFQSCNHPFKSQLFFPGLVERRIPEKTGKCSLESCVGFVSVWTVQKQSARSYPWVGGFGPWFHNGNEAFRIGTQHFEQRVGVGVALCERGYFVILCRRICGTWYLAALDS